MNINKNNYEAFFLDYHEGNLSPQQVADLFLFLSQYPELKKEFDDFEHIILEDFSGSVFENKEQLKKNITADNREDYFIRAIENTLDPAELALLDQFLKTHPEFLAEFNLFRKTKLQADVALVFENKTHLKQPLAANDDYLISAMEGLLSAKEQVIFEKQVAINPELQKSIALYQKTKMVFDAAVVYPDKQSLKRKEKKVIPLYYYVAAAASVILLIGLFFLWRTGEPANEQRFAEQKKQTDQKEQIKQVSPPQFTQAVTEQKKTEPFSFRRVADIHTKRTAVKKPSGPHSPATSTNVETSVPHEPEIIPSAENPVALTNPVQEKQNIINPVDSDKVERPTSNTAPAIAKIENKAVAPNTSKAPGYASLRDILASKLKEKLVGKDVSDAENQNKRISGWDVAGAFAKGLSRVTGKKIEVKPQFNSEGNVTAYALSAGKLEFSRVK